MERNLSIQDAYCKEIDAQNYDFENVVVQTIILPLIVWNESTVIEIR